MSEDKKTVLLEIHPSWEFVEYALGRFILDSLPMSQFYQNVLVEVKPPDYRNEKVQVIISKKGTLDESPVHTN